MVGNGIGTTGCLWLQGREIGVGPQVAGNLLLPPESVRTPQLLVQVFLCLYLVGAAFLQICESGPFRGHCIRRLLKCGQRSLSLPFQTVAITVLGGCFLVIACNGLVGVVRNTGL